MKHLRAWLAVLSITAALHAEEAPTAEVLGASPSGDLKVMGYRNDSGEGVTVWVESHGKRTDLPASPVGLTAASNEGDSWQQLIPPAFAVSPDGQSLFATQKICTGYAIGFLYQRSRGLDFKIATKTRFDALAWRFFGRREGIDVEDLIASDSPSHLIDFAGFGNRYLAVSLRGVIDNVPPGKKVASNPEFQRGSAGVYDWQCIYDLQEKTFLVPDVMKTNNAKAWSRWAAEDASVTWAKDADQELNDAYRALMAALDPAEQKKLRIEQRAWLVERDTKSKDKTVTISDFVQSRAVALQIRLLEQKGKETANAE